MKTNLLSVSLLTITLAACASAPTNDGAVGAGTTAAAATSQPDPNTELAGTWGFVLTASDVAAPLRERCAKEAASDAKKAEACWNEIAAESAREKIRFATDGAGHTVWTSFGSEGQKEIVFLEVPVELVADGPGHVLAKISGAAKGVQAERFAKASVNVMRIEKVDARTIAMNDPKKGRLVFAKE